jgi:hypothetical protein
LKPHKQRLVFVSNPRKTEHLVGAAKKTGLRMAFDRGLKLEFHGSQVTPDAGLPPPAAAPVKEPLNYLIRVEWKEPKGDPQSLEVLTTEGHFSLSTIQKTSVKINGSDIPTTLKFEGTLTALDNKKAQLQLFLGRTVPYVTGTYSAGPSVSSSYSQVSVGLDSTFLVKFGKPAVIQNDESGQISVLVKRMEL